MTAINSAAISEVQGSQIQLKNHQIIREIVLGSKNSKNANTGVSIDDKPKSEWNLQDYRKNDPKALENDPELYQKLIKAEYKQ